MKIKRYFMEDWLNDSVDRKFNLAESGCPDFYLKGLLEICNVDITEFNKIFLGNNDTKGSLRLRKEICKSYKKAKLEEVMVTNGSSEAIFCFFNELLDKGDEVVMHFPAFQCLYEVPVSIGCKIKFLNLFECKNWRLDVNKLDKMVSKKTKLIIVNNPHNPFGWTLSAEELKRIGEIAKKNDCYLFFDEHYRYLPLREGTDLIPSGYDICKPFYEKTFATGSMIKCLGLVGIRIGWLIADPNLLSKCRDYKDYITHTIPEVTDYIAYIALKNKEKIIKMRKETLLKNLPELNRFMERNKDFFEYVEPTGGVVCFPKLKNFDSTKFCEELFDKYGVSLLPSFAFETDDHFRLNFSAESEKFKNTLGLIQEHIDKINSKRNA